MFNWPRMVCSLWASARHLSPPTGRLATRPPWGYPRPEDTGGTLAAPAHPTDVTHPQGLLQAGTGTLLIPEINMAQHLFLCDSKRLQTAFSDHQCPSATISPYASGAGAVRLLCTAVCSGARCRAEHVGHKAWGRRSAAATIFNSCRHQDGPNHVEETPSPITGCLLSGLWASTGHPGTDCCLWWGL